MPCLPSEVILDILSRLPVKSLLRFRCVSKPWCSNIDSPNFIKLHLIRSLKTNVNLIFIGTKVCFMDLDSVGAPRPVISQQLEAPFECPQVFDSCNGVLCICNPSEEFTFWNPSTRKHHVLPPFAPPFAPPDCSTRKFVHFGFGFDAINEDYKVVRILQASRIKDGVSLDAEVKVYSLRSDSWKRIYNLKYFVSPTCTQGQGAYADGALHWVVNKKDDNVKQLLVAFDLGVEEFREIPQPEYGDEFVYMSLSVLGGCLCICYYFRVAGVEGRYNRVDVWVMKESWIKLFSMPKVRTSTFGNGGLRPFAYSKSGEQVISEHCGKGFLLYDLIKKKSWKERIVGVGSLFTVDICVGSLVPINPGGLNKEKHEREQKGRKKGRKTDDFLSVGFKLVL